MMQFMPSVAVGDEFVYVCQAKNCTRFMVPWLPEAYTYEEQDRWLIAPHRLNHDLLIVRCPQHISTVALRSTIGRHPDHIAWAKQAKIDDAPTHANWSPATPYPIDPRILWTADGRLSYRRRRRRKT